MKLSLEGRLTILVFSLSIMASGIATLFHYWIDDLLLAFLVATTLTLISALTVLRWFMNPINRVLQALVDGFHNFLDSDFSVSLGKLHDDELGALIDAYNRVGESLRDERVHLYQRELLLDTVIQATPLSLLLTDDSEKIIYSNNAARKLLAEGKAINGLDFFELLDKNPRPFRRSVDAGLNGLFTVEIEQTAETFHLTHSQFLLNGKKHQLYLFKALTKEISRQEVNTWKKVIRLISHELNNSLAPISSLAHSGQLLSQRISDDKLSKIFVTMEERAKYLQGFIEGYAKFSRLPKPRIEKLSSYAFLAGLQQIHPFTLECEENTPDIHCDPAQMQQVVINLVKNALESGSEENQVSASLTANAHSFEIQIKDRGKGMNERTLSNALLPFYSTKSEGTGLGLPLCREIVEAHGGKMLIANRTGGGLKISLLLPNLDPAMED